MAFRRNDVVWNIIRLFCDKGGGFFVLVSDLANLRFLPTFKEVLSLTQYLRNQVETLEPVYPGSYADLDALACYGSHDKFRDIYIALWCDELRYHISGN